MIEDKKTNVDMISKIIPVFVFDAPYNQTCSGTNVIRVYSWYQVYQEITEKFCSSRNIIRGMNMKLNNKGFGMGTLIFFICLFFVILLAVTYIAYTNG